MARPLTEGPVMGRMLVFSLPLIAGNLLQQLYNLVDTLVVGRYIGANALAAVGSSFTLMVFLTSILLGFCMGSGVVFAQLYGAKRYDALKLSLVNAFGFIGLLTVLLTVLAYLLLGPLLRLLNIQPEAYAYTVAYLRIVLAGLPFTFLFNFFASALRSVGNSLAPLLFLGLACLVNIVLDIVFVLPLGWGVQGAAWATLIAQALSAVLACLWFWRGGPLLRPAREHLRLDKPLLKQVVSCSALTSVQQSVMNFGILLVQGLVNSFGVATMAAFAAAVKIDSLAYMPVQDFGNAYSTFVAQNYGAGNAGRIRKGTRGAVLAAGVFCALVAVLVVAFAPRLMALFLESGEAEVIRIGAEYLRVEGIFYPLIGWLFLLYGMYRGLGRPGMSLLLSAVSLGTRVCLAYLLAPVPTIGLMGIWVAIPVGWFLADALGFTVYFARRKALLPPKKE